MLSQADRLDFHLYAHMPRPCMRGVLLCLSDTVDWINASENDRKCIRIMAAMNLGTIFSRLETSMTAETI